MLQNLRFQVHLILNLPSDLEFKEIEEVLEWAVRCDVSDVNRIVEEIRDNMADEDVENEGSHSRSRISSRIM